MESFEDITLPPHANPIVIKWLKIGRVKIMSSGCWEKQPNRKTRNPFRSHDSTMHRLVINCEDGYLVRHLCNNPPCLNPSHLKQGTNLENSQDRKGRTRLQIIAERREYMARKFNQK